MLPKRKPIRFKKYDYSVPGCYYVTICTHNRRPLFGNIVGVLRAKPNLRAKPDLKMKLNQYGQIVACVWQSLSEHHPIELDVYQIMPNHVHFILKLLPSDTGIARNAPTFQNVTAGSLACVIRSFKSECTKQTRRLMKNKKFIVWQRNYYEHIVRNEKSLNEIRQYIVNNPQMWYRDRNNPDFSTSP